MCLAEYYNVPLSSISDSIRFSGYHITNNTDTCLEVCYNNRFVDVPYTKALFTRNRMCFCTANSSFTNNMSMNDTKCDPINKTCPVESGVNLIDNTATSLDVKLSADPAFVYDRLNITLELMKPPSSTLDSAGEFVRK